MLLALDATIVAWSRAGERRIPVDDFFGPHFTNALTAGELVAAVEFPVQRAGSTWGFAEFARRRGDYAIGGAAVHAERDDAGRCTAVRAGLIAAGPSPTLAPGLADLLVDRVVDAGLVDAAVSLVVSRLAAGENVHGSAEYRSSVIGEMLRRALSSAFDLAEAA